MKNGYFLVNTPSANKKSICIAKVSKIKMTAKLKISNYPIFG